MKLISLCARARRQPEIPIENDRMLGHKGTGHRS